MASITIEYKSDVELAEVETDPPAASTFSKSPLTLTYLRILFSFGTYSGKDSPFLVCQLTHLQKGKKLIQSQERPYCAKLHRT